MIVLGVVLDRRLTFHKHVSMVARSFNYHAQAIRHIRRLPSTELTQTLACSLIPSGMHYCNAVLHGAPTGTIQKLQRVQNNGARIVLQAPRQSHAKPFLHELHWLPVLQQRVTLAPTSWQFWRTKFVIERESLLAELSCTYRIGRHCRVDMYIMCMQTCWVALSGLSQS